MMETILELFVDLGLLREDYKHHKKITKKEKEDGRKRHFQRYFLQPSSVLVIAILLIGSISAIIFFTYQRTSIYPEKTKKELLEMTSWIEKRKEKFGKYPEDLNEMIGNNPIRKHWANDAWGRPYKYVITNEGKEYLLISAGSDGKFETEDDLIGE